MVEDETAEQNNTRQQRPTAGKKIKANEGPSRWLPDSCDKWNTGCESSSEHHRTSTIHRVRIIQPYCTI